MKTSFSLAKLGAAALLLGSLTSCEDILEQYFPKPTPPPTIPTFPPLGQDISFYALAGGTRLDAYSTANAATRTSSVALTGLGSGETILAIDFRPATGQLYGVSSASRLYVINQNTGVARAIGAGAFSPAVAGNLVGFDFNPTVDRIRLVTSTGQNLRLNPETGTVAATDGPLNGVAGATVSAAAYSNNTALASTTVLYTLDPATDKLYRQDPPNEGKLVEVGSLNLNLTGEGGFDIDGKTNTALSLFEVEGQTTLFTLNLQTGATQALAKYATALGYTSLAIPIQPLAYSVNSADDLLIFELENPASYAKRRITGLPPEDEVIALDFRPANGQLYILTRRFGDQFESFATVRLFTLNAATAAATLVGPVSIPLSRTTLGFDFDPVADRIRIVTSNETLRVNPVNAAATVDVRFNSGTVFLPRAAAYDNNFAGATTTNFYVISSVIGSSFGAVVSKLYVQNTPTTGALTGVGDMTIQSQENVENFDIGGTSNKGYAIIQVSGDQSYLHDIDLRTGAARRVSTFNYNSFPDFRVVPGLAVGLGF